MSNVGDAVGSGFGDTIGGMFDIPEMHVVEQTEEAWTIGDTSQPGSSITPDDTWDPLAGF